ncbi:MAG: rhodanese-like domain-containing protein [Thermodesulfobacteriota bacterium]
MRHITREELNSALDNGEKVTLVEALPERYWRDGHLPGAIQIDHTEVSGKAGAMLPDKRARIVVYCASTECQNSTKAARTLESLGYTDVYEYVEGKKDWTEAGLPLEKEQNKN